MAQLDKASADGILKRFYLPAVREQLNNKVDPVLAQLDSRSEIFAGERWELSTHIGRSGGLGNLTDTGTLPAAGKQTHVKAYGTTQQLAGRVQLTLMAMKATEKSEGAFISAVSSELEGITNDIQYSLGRQVHGDGSGKIATCDTTSASATVQLAAATTRTQMRGFWPGQRVDIGTVANNDAVVAAATIIAVDAANKTITIDSSVTTAGTDFVFHAGNGTQTGGTQVELTGVAQIVAATGSLHGIDPATYGEWASYVETGAAAISEDLIVEDIDEIEVASGKVPNLVVTDYAVHRGLGNVLKAYNRYNDTVELRGGWNGIRISTPGGDVAVTRSRFCPEGTVEYLNTEHLTKPTLFDWEFMDQDGSQWSRVPNKTAYESTLVGSFDVATDRRNAHGRRTNVTS